MDIHQNARLTLRSREQLAQAVQQGMTLNAAAAAFKVSRRTAGKWSRRFRQQGRAGRRQVVLLKSVPR
jgi:transposase